MAYKDKATEQAHDKAKYLANREKILARTKAYYAAHRDDCCAQRAIHYEEHKEAIKAHARAYRIANLEKVREQGRARRVAQKDKFNARASAYYYAHQDERKAYNAMNSEKKKAYMKQYNAAHREEWKANYEANKEKYRFDRIARVYGLTSEAFFALLSKQGGRCANPGCRTSNFGPKGPCLDHDHVFGHVRGILCHKCNSSLGLLNDSTLTIRGLASYLGKANTFLESDMPKGLRKASLETQKVDDLDALDPQEETIQ